MTAINLLSSAHATIDAIDRHVQSKELVQFQAPKDHENYKTLPHHTGLIRAMIGEPQKRFYDKAGSV